MCGDQRGRCHLSGGECNSVACTYGMTQTFEVVITRLCLAMDMTLMPSSGVYSYFDVRAWLCAE